MTEMPAISGGGDSGEMQGRELHRRQRSHPADEEEAVRETRRPVGLAVSSAGQMAVSESRVAQEGESTGVICP